MKAYLFSVGESTTDLARWSLERLGHEVIMLGDPNTSFHQKYMEFLARALDAKDKWCIRADADMIMGRGLNKMISYAEQQLAGLWWLNGKSFCFHRMELIESTPSVIHLKGIKAAAMRVLSVKQELRPETALTRIPEFYNPRRFAATDYFLGIHGYKQHEGDIARVMNMKAQRDQLKEWDLEMIEKLNAFEL